MRFAWLILLAIAFIPGCAFIDSTLTLEHVPVMEKRATSPLPVFLSRVNDRRPDPTRIGCKKNGMGSETADLFLDVPLTNWIGGVMNEEFKRAGLTLVGSDDRSAVRVEVDLLDFFIEPDVGMTFDIWAVVHAEITVRFPNGTGFARRFAALSNESSILPTDGSYTDQMEHSMRMWVHQVVSEIVALISTRNTARSEEVLFCWRAGL